VSVASGEPPSLFYSTLAAAIIDETGLAGRFPFQRMVDRIGSMLTEQLSGENVNLVADIVAAARLLQTHGRPIPDTATIGRFVRQSTLLSEPMRHQSLVELCELSDLLGDVKERERLAPIVRSRMWEILQLNPRKGSAGAARLLSGRGSHRRARIDGRQRRQCDDCGDRVSHGR
jgi:hypothetical protein